MDIHEFDEIYDAEIERIFRSLPNAEKYPMPTIVCPVDLGKMNLLSQIFNKDEFYRERQDKIVQHTIEFKKVFVNGRWIWKRS